MKFGAEEIQETAATLGFRPDSLERVFRLLSLLETLRSNAFLRPRVALKGGTALTLDSKPLGPAVAREIAVVDRHELAAGKLAALVARNASRDIFDARELLRRTDLDRDKLRLAFVVYGGLNRKDWRTVRIEDVAAEPAELKRELVPMLRAEVRPKDADVVPWAEALVRETRTLMSAVLPLEAHELEFVERLNGAGDIAPELLTGDPAMQATIREQPGLKWKAMNVKKLVGGVSRAHLLGLLDAGELPADGDGNARRVQRDALFAFKATRNAERRADRRAARLVLGGDPRPGALRLRRGRQGRLGQGAPGRPVGLRNPTHRSSPIT